VLVVLYASPNLDAGLIISGPDNPLNQPSTCASLVLISFNHPTTLTLVCRLLVVDQLADDKGCARDLPQLKKLGVNAIRAYSVDSTLNHDSCMAALSGAGIYVMCVVASFHSFYSADNNHTGSLDLTLRASPCLRVLRPH
jgi:hypothetical protein